MTAPTRHDDSSTATSMSTSPPASSDPPASRSRRTVALAAAWAGLAVALGAFGAHALDGRVPDARLATFETGVRYHLWHALGALAVSALGAPRLCASLLLAGSAVFAGSLYLLVLADAPWLGAVAPVGGALMIGGWALSAWRLARG